MDTHWPTSKKINKRKPPLKLEWGRRETAERELSHLTILSQLFQTGRHQLPETRHQLLTPTGRDTVSNQK